MTTAETQARINRALAPAFAETAAMAWLRNAAKQLDRIEANERAQEKGETR